MAIRPDYDVGDLTLTSGSSDFTTSGSSLQTAAVQPGDAIIAPSGHVLIIASITGQNSGTLFLPCPAAAAGTGLPLRIRFQPDGSRYQGAVRVLIDLLSSGNLEAFAALVGAAGMVPIFTGPGTLDLADPATFGIKDPNGNLGKLAALTLVASKVFATNGASNPILATIAEVLGYTPANKAGDTFTGVTRFEGAGTTQATWGADPNRGSLYSQGGYPAIALAGPNITYMPSNGAWLLRNGDINIEQGALNVINNVINSQFAGTGTRIRWGQSASTLSALGIEAGGSGQIALYGSAAITYFSGDGANLLRGSSYQISRGNLSVSGSLSKGSGTFLIDHPLDPLNKNLRHGFVEAPRYDLIYRGTVRLVAGRASVDIDAASNMSAGTFAVLTTNAVVTSLQNQEGFARLKPGPINGGSFEIICEDENCTDLVSWVVIAERDDPFVKSDLDQNTDSDGRFVPEFEKEDA